MKKNIIKTISFILILTLLIGGVTEFLKVNSPGTLIGTIGYTHEAENSLDVVFLGQSEVYTGIIPTLAWKEHQFTSYCYGLSGMPANMMPAAVKQIAKTQNPKLLVVEITAFTKDEDYFERYGQMHNYIDEMPWGSDRDEIIKSAVDEDHQEEFYKPVSTCHGNWKLPQKCFQSSYFRISSLLGGRSSFKGHCSNAGKIQIKKKIDKKLCFIDKDKKYLEETIQACKDAGFERVLFVRFPHYREIENKEALKELKQVVEDAGYDYKNYNSDFKKTKIDKDNDFYDADHMNIYGAEKFTKFFAKALDKKYKLSGDHEQELVDRWDKDAEYVDQMLEIGRKKVDANTRHYINEFSF